MKIRFLFLTLFCGICFSVSSQVDSFQQNIIEYLNCNGTDTQYAQAYDDIFEVLKKQFTVPEVPEEVWRELKVDKAESVQNAIVFLTFAYRNHFTEAEIIDMTTFYQTEAAQKMMLNASNISKEENVQIQTFLNSKIKKKMDAKQEALLVDIDEITRHWRTDLFAEKMKILIKKKYSTKQ